MSEPDKPQRELTQAEWFEKLKDPDYLERQVNYWRALVRGEHGAIPVEHRQQCEHNIAWGEAALPGRRVSAKLAVLDDLVKGPPTGLSREQWHTQCRQLAEEITDELLSVPEPDRSAWLQEFLPVRDEIRSWNKE